MSIFGSSAMNYTVWSKNSLNPSCPATVFSVDGILDWEVPLLSAESWIARRCNPRPEQKVAHQTEDARHKDQLPFTRTPNHIISSCPSIRLSGLSAKMRKCSIAARVDQGNFQPVSEHAAVTMLPVPGVPCAEEGNEGQFG
jgi:hypothetical protein